MPLNSICRLTTLLNSNNQLESVAKCTRQTEELSIIIITHKKQCSRCKENVGWNQKSAKDSKVAILAERNSKYHKRAKKLLTIYKAF